MQHSPPFQQVQVEPHSLGRTLHVLHELVLQRMDQAAEEWGLL